MTDGPNPMDDPRVKALGPIADLLPDALAAIRALPTPTAAELMARIQTGEKE